MTFEQFMARADALVSSRYGIGIHDCVDACWFDAWKDSGLEDEESPTDASILDIAVDTLSDADDLFAQMVEIAEAGGGCE